MVGDLVASSNKCLLQSMRCGVAQLSALRSRRDEAVECQDSSLTSSEVRHRSITLQSPKVCVYEA